MNIKIIGLSSRHYAEIRTLEQLRAERQKLNRVLEMQEQLLQEDYRTVKGIFTVSYVTGMVVKRLESWQHILRAVFDAYLFTMAFFRKQSKEQKRAEAQ